MKANNEVLVCDKCFRACCWYGEFMCDEAVGAGLCVLTVGDLRKLKLEHSEYWTKKTFLRVYGTASPRFRERRITLKDARAALS